MSSPKTLACEENAKKSEIRSSLAKTLFLTSCEFRAAVTEKNHLTFSDLPEVAFAGRSNVGKSSLLNALTGRKALARTSQTPGCTKGLNFFNLANKMYLVDLPGYGYAAASKTQTQAWLELIELYLKERRTLLQVYVLVDCRRNLQPIDLSFLASLEEATLPYQIVLTKCDKLKGIEQENLKQDLMRQILDRPFCQAGLMLTSHRSGQGIEELRENVAHLLNQLLKAQVSNQISIKNR